MGIDTSFEQRARAEVERIKSERVAEEERQERERPKRCPECGKSWEPLVIEAWSPEEAREKAQERSSQ